jgi:hypothetical protein
VASGEVERGTAGAGAGADVGVEASAGAGAGAEAEAEAPAGVSSAPAATGGDAPEAPEPTHARPDCGSRGQAGGGHASGGLAGAAPSSQPSPPPVARDASSAVGGERAVFRRLVALLCDDYHDALSLLARVLPRALVSRHLYRAEPAPPADPSEIWRALGPSERARLKALSRADRER